MEVLIVIDGLQYGIRNWHAIPRVGEQVMVRRPGGVLNQYDPVIVRQVIWGVGLNKRVDENNYVTLLCEWLPPQETSDEH